MRRQGGAEVLAQWLADHYACERARRILAGLTPQQALVEISKPENTSYFAWFIHQDAVRKALKLRTERCLCWVCSTPAQWRVTQAKVGRLRMDTEGQLYLLPAK